MGNEDSYMLSTSDNPYNPFVDFDKWRVWDESEGYYSLAYQARIAWVSDELPESLYKEAIVDAIDEIVDFNLSGVHIKVTPTTKTPVSASEG
jgi:hypothetical protein